jgi:hypothetical protein
MEGEACQQAVRAILLKEYGQEAEKSKQAGKQKGDVEECLLHTTTRAIDVLPAKDAAQPASGLPLDQDDANQGNGHNIGSKHKITSNVHLWTPSASLMVGGPYKKGGAATHF